MKTHTAGRITGMVAASALAVGLGAVAASPAVAAPPTPKAQVFWASPTGSGADCTEKEPCSLEGARDKVRTVNSNMTRDIVVNLTDGEYELASTFSLTEDATTHDSGTNGFNIIYRNAPGAAPVLSGGEDISGFTLHDSALNIYAAPVSAELEARQLYVDGVRATRARTADNPEFGATATGYAVPASGPYADMDEWGNPSDIEVAAMFSWKQARYSVKSIAGTAMTMDEEGWKAGATQSEYAARRMMWIENAYELLDAPGEWYLDREGDTLYYIPLGDTLPSDSDFVVGGTERLVQATGTPSTPLHNIQFIGLTFAHDSWNEPSTTKGYPDFQGGAVYRGTGTWDDNNYLTPAGVDFRHVHGVVVKDNTFEHMANAALAFGPGSQYNVIDGNSFSDISGNGINIGGITKADHHPTDPAYIVKNNVISNNEVTTVGAEYRGNSAIFLGYTQGSQVKHNTLHDLPYTGISMGWGWGYIDELGTPVAKDNVIQGNLIYDIMNTVNDGGAIYTLGSQPGSKVIDNYAYANHHPYGFLYRDNGSAGFLDANNVVSSADSGTNIWYRTNVGSGGYWNAHDNVSEGNFFSSDLSTTGTGGSNAIRFNTPVIDSAWPARARKVIAEAGVGGADLAPLPLGEPPISRNKTAVASSISAEANSADHAVDGDPETRWAQTPGKSDPSWLTVDLGESYIIEGTATSFYAHGGNGAGAGDSSQRGAKYKIEYSADGATWSTFVDKTDAFSIPGQDTAEGEVIARYVRITFTATQSRGASVTEFDVFGHRPTPISQGKTATASSMYSAAYGPAKAVDGDPDTRWAQAGGRPDPSWLQVDLGENYVISKTQTSAYLHSGNGVTYKIEYSLDGVNWSTFAERTTFTTPGVDAPAEPVTARYVRITFSNTQLQGGSIYEFTVWR